MAENAGDTVDSAVSPNLAGSVTMSEVKAEIKNTRRRLASNLDLTTQRLRSALGVDAGAEDSAHHQSHGVGTTGGVDETHRLGHKALTSVNARTVASLIAGATVGLTLVSRIRRRRRDWAKHQQRNIPLDITRVSAILLDVDGTLIDSNAAHADTWAQALTESGLPCTAAQVRPFIGMGGDKLLPALAGVEEDSLLGLTVIERKKALFAERVPQLQPTPGARALVAYLRQVKKDVVVATSADDKEMLALLERAGVADLIARRTSKDDAAESKPDPDIIRAALKRAGSRASRTWMIGDTPYDIEAAGRAGVGTIALRCGGHWSDVELRSAIAIFNDPETLLRQWNTGSR